MATVSPTPRRSRRAAGGWADRATLGWRHHPAPRSATRRDTPVAVRPPAAATASLDDGADGPATADPSDRRREVNQVAYDAVSAYTVLFGDGESPARVSVHGSADEAWSALDVLVRGRSRLLRAGAVDPRQVTERAERWRSADPERRYWQVAPHRLQVTVPAVAR